MGMIIHLVLIVILPVLAFAFAVEKFFSNADKPSALATILLFLTILLIVIFMINANELERQEWEISENPYRTDYIVNLNDSSQINGRFYLRRGYIEEDMYYQYMMKTSDGGFSYGKVKEDATTIYVTDSNFRVEWYKEKRNWLWFDEESELCKIYVPKDCIQEDYNIDLE